MTSSSHDDNVVARFGARAAAYLGSAVHAGGEDLQQLAALAQGQGGAQVLDLGCGAGHVSFHVAPHVARVVAVDLSEAMLAAVTQGARERGLANIEVQQASVEALPHADASFDIVMSRFSAHHWRNAAAGLREARRVLKPGGVLAMADLVAPTNAIADTHLQAVELLRDTSHGRDYSLAEWSQMLAAAGFSLDTVTTRRLRLEFASWIARMATPPEMARAVRALQAVAPAEVRAHFAIEADGSFTCDTAVMVAH